MPQGRQRVFYSEVIGSLKRDLVNKKRLNAKVKTLSDELYESQSLYLKMVNAQKLLSTVSDDNAERTLNFITGIVNKALAEIFNSDSKRIRMTKKLYGQSKPHIIVELINGDNQVLDMSIQNGAGLRQVVSFMYVICLIEIRKGRRLLLLDERLNGLHKEAKRIIAEIIKIFAEGGFQFIFVEYSLNNLGKIYNIERKGNESVLVPVNTEDYTDDMVYSDVDLDILDKDYKEEEEDLVEEVVIA